VKYQRRLSNDLSRILEELAPYRSAIVGLAVESTFNWYWLVDGLMEEGYRVHLANPAAMQQNTGLKYTDDDYDARWLAHMLRLGVLPEGYIYPKEERPVRDLLRKRAQMVRFRTANLLSVGYWGRKEEFNSRRPPAPIDKGLLMDDPMAAWLRSELSQHGQVSPVSA
jgi:transposase